MEKNFQDGDIVDVEALMAKGLMKGRNVMVKLLGNGDLTKKLEIKLPALSASAAEKVKKAGGTVICGCSGCAECGAQE